MTFAVKNAFVADYARKSHPSFYTSAQRREFRDRLAIPKNVVVWFGSISPVLGKFDSRDLLDRTNQLGINVFTFSAGHLVLQVFAAVSHQNRAARRRAAALADDTIPIVTQHPAWCEYATPIWPDVAGASWPPVRNLGHEQIKNFQNRFSQFYLLQNPRR